MLNGSDAPPAPAGGDSPILVRGGGDLGTGVAVTLRHAGYDVVVVDLPRPTTLRLTAAFAAASLWGAMEVDGVAAVHVEEIPAVRALLAAGKVAVWTGSEAALRAALSPGGLVEARMRGLSEPSLRLEEAPVVIALGPGYEAGVHCHYVIETNRGPSLGAAIERGCPEEHTGIPGEVCGLTEERILRAPADGMLARVREIGDLVEPDAVVATVAGAPARARIGGMVRGLKLSGLRVSRGHKIGDIDPRRDPALLRAPSDKSARVGAGVVAALRLARAAGKKNRGAGAHEEELCT